MKTGVFVSAVAVAIALTAFNPKEADAQSPAAGAELAVGQVCHTMVATVGSLVRAIRIPEQEPAFFFTADQAIETGYAGIKVILKLKSTAAKDRVGGDRALGYREITTGVVGQVAAIAPDDPQPERTRAILTSVFDACWKMLKTGEVVWPDMYPLSDLAE